MDHPLNESKKIEKIAQSYQAFIAYLPQRAALDPFLDHFSPSAEPYPNQRLYEEVGTLGEQPLAAELSSWVYYLLESRLMLLAEAREAELFYRQPYQIDALGSAAQTLQQLQARTLVGSLVQRRQNLEGFVEASPELAAFRRARGVRLREFFQRLAEPNDEQYSSPLPLGSALQLAREVLDKTHDLAREELEPGYLAFQQALQASSSPGRRGAEEGWPARLAQDVLLDLLGKPKELRETRLVNLRLPLRRAPVSFLDAFYQLGREFSRELYLPQESFIQRSHPYELELDRWGYFLGLSVSSGNFARRRLGVGASASKEFHRALLLSWILQLRRLAADVIVKAALQKSDADFIEATQELSAELYQEEYSLDFCIAHRPIRRRAEVQLVQLLRASVMVEEKKNAFDEDFLEQPRAWEEFRSMLVSRPIQLSPGEQREAHEADARQGVQYWLELFAQSSET